MRIKKIQGLLYHLYLRGLVIPKLYPSFKLPGKTFISTSWNAVGPSHLQIQPTADGGEEKKRLPGSSKKQKLNLPHTESCVESI